MQPTAVHTWLEDSDPALRWQVQRDLLHEPPEVWEATRALITTEGYGARLLELQEPDGQWAGGAYFPRGHFDTVDDQRALGQPWTATTWALTALREWGADPAVLRERGTVRLLEENSRWEYNDLPYWGGEVDCCINAMTLANGLWLDADVGELAGWFPEHRMADGGWNCEWVEGSVRSSFHSTLNSVKALLAHQATTGGTGAGRDARRAGEGYLLERDLFRRLSTGEAVGTWVDNFAYPFRWIYSVLGAAEHFRQASLLDGTPPDPRMAEAIDMIRRARGFDGTWSQGFRPPGEVWFEVDVPQGEPSKWVTLYAARVLEWWDRSSTSSASTTSA